MYFGVACGLLVIPSGADRLATGRLALPTGSYCYVRDFVSTDRLDAGAEDFG